MPPPAMTPPPSAPAGPPTTPYVPPPPVASGGGTSNGMAIAALVLGIVSLVLFFACGAGILAGVLAAVFGFLGLSKAKQSGQGRGMSLAGLILGLIGIIGGILFLVLVTIGINNADHTLNDIGGVADSSDYELKTGDCQVDRYGEVTFDGTIQNTAGRDMNFTIEGQIREAGSGNLLESPSAYVQVPEGQTAKWTMTTFLSDPTDVTCEVNSVNNFFNN